MTEKVQPFPIELREYMHQKRPAIASTLPAGIDPERFLQVALLAATKNHDLWKCSKESILLAVMESARAGLHIDNKEATIIPFGGQAQFLPMIAGIIRLMRRSEHVTKVEARVVRDGDEFDFEYGLVPRLEHKPLVTGELEPLITHAYAIMWFDNADPTFEVMERDELDLVRSISKAPNSPAYTKFPGEMDRKIVTKRLSKYADLSPEAQRAIAIDHELFGDPQMDGFVDGLSEEYRNSLVKSQTQAGIDRLKEEMETNGAGGDVEVEGDVESGDEIERAEQFVEELAEDPKDAAPEKIDYTTEFWALANQLEWDKHKVADFLVLHDDDFEKAYAELKKQDGGLDD